MFRFFVSSTFNDMHHERDILQKRVFSKVNSYASKIGESVYFSDLRWGVNTAGLDEAAASRKIIENCIEEVENCRPYMIVILGSRFGTVMGDKIINEYTDKYGWDKCNGISVTALEIMAGEKFIGLDKILFYFRDIEGEYPKELFEDDYEDGKKKLIELKEKIEKSGAKVSRYTVRWNAKTNDIEGFEQFAELVEKDVETTINENHEAKNENIVFADNVAANAYISDEFISRIKNHLKTANAIVLKGGEYSGKTSTAACIVKQLKNDGYNVYPIFIKEGYKGKFDKKSMKEYIHKRMPEYKNNDSILFVIDGIDIISDSIKERNIVESMISDIDGMTGNHKLIITSSVDVLDEKATIIGLDERLDSKSIEGLQRTLLAGKEIPNEVRTAIEKKCIGKQYLYEKLLLQRLDMMTAGDYSQIDSYRKNKDTSVVDATIATQLSIIDNLPEEICELAYKSCMDFASDYEEEVINQSLWLLANSLDGFKLEDLVKILKFEEYRDDMLVYLLSACKNVFISRQNGKIDFISQKIKLYFQEKMRRLMGTSEKEIFESAFWTLYGKETNADYKTEAFFWLVKGGLSDRECVEFFLKMEPSTRSKMLKLFDDQNVNERINSEKDIEDRVTWAYTLGNSIGEYNMSSDMLFQYLDLLYEIMEEESVHRFINCAYLLNCIKELIKIRIKNQSSVSSILGIKGFTGKWESELNKAIDIQIKIYEYLQLDCTKLRDEFEIRREKLAEYYKNDPVTVINNGLLLINETKKYYEHYNELDEISKRIIGASKEIIKQSERRGGASGSKCLVAAAYVLYRTGDLAAMGRNDFEKAMYLYNNALEFLKICNDQGDNSWILMKEIGFLYHRMAVCMERKGNRPGYVRKCRTNAKSWLQSAYRDCDDPIISKTLLDAVRSLKTKV